MELLVPSVDVEDDLLGALEEFRNLPRVCDFAGGGEVVVVVVEAGADGGGPERNLPRRGGGGAVVPSAFSAIVKAWLTTCALVIIYDIEFSLSDKITPHSLWRIVRLVILNGSSMPAR